MPSTSGMYPAGLLALLDNSISAGLTDAAAIKYVLVDTTYTLDATTQDQDNVDDAVQTTTDITTKELSGVSGYTGGFAGAGRKDSEIDISVDDTSDPGKVIVEFENTGSNQITWSALGGGGDNIGGIALICEITNDAASIPILMWGPSSDLTLNGGDVTLTFASTAAGGNLAFTCTRA